MVPSRSLRPIVALLLSVSAIVAIVSAYLSLAKSEEKRISYVADICSRIDQASRLGAGGPEKVSSLMRQATRKYGAGAYGVVIRGFDALDRVGNETARAETRSFLLSPIPGVRLMAIGRVTHNRDRDAIPALLNLAEDKNESVRQEAIRALKRLRDEEAKADARPR